MNSNDLATITLMSAVMRDGQASAEVQALYSAALVKIAERQMTVDQCFANTLEGIPIARTQPGPWVPRYLTIDQRRMMQTIHGIVSEAQEATQSKTRFEECERAKRCLSVWIGDAP